MPPYQPFDSRVLNALRKLFEPETSRRKWLTRVASGTFANVFKIKTYTGELAFLLIPTLDPILKLTITHVCASCEGVCSCISESDNDKLKDTVVRVLKPSLEQRVFKKESTATVTIARLPPHFNLLQEQILMAGVSLSRMYDESLHHYAPTQTLSDERALTCVFKSLVEAVSYLHQNGYGHFDIKPSNILIKWAHRRGVFQGSQVVVADFGLAKKFSKNGTPSRSVSPSYSPSHLAITLTIIYCHTGEYVGTWRGTKEFMCPELSVLKSRGVIKLGDRCVWGGSITSFHLITPPHLTSQDRYILNRRNYEENSHNDDFTPGMDEEF